MTDTDDSLPDGTLPPEAAPEDGIEPMFIRLLQQLWEAAHDERERDWSLPKLSKRSLLPMSTLRRALSQLEEELLVQVSRDEAGRETVTLSDEGREVCEQFFGDAFGDKA
jgi:DNA-binding MarR family transcriptional regulator